MSKEQMKSSMTPEERNKRRNAVGKAASEKTAKSEQLNFRIEEQAILDLQAIAFAKRMPVGTMIRDWVLERLSQEKLGTPDLTGRALLVLDEIHGKLTCLFEAGQPDWKTAFARSCAESPVHTPGVTALPPELSAQPCSPFTSPTELESSCLPSPHPGVSGFPASFPSISDCQAAMQATFDNASQLEHLRAMEHLLVDQLFAIRSQRESVERKNKP